jgi:plastocyanin
MDRKGSRIVLRGALVLLLVLPFLAPSAIAADAYSFDLTATETVTGEPTFLASATRNPTLFATPGSHVTIHLKNEGGLPHNIVLGAPVATAMPCCLQPGEQGDLAFDLPAGFTGDIAYQCALHGGSGMRGVLHVGAPQASVRILAPLNASTVRGEVVARVATENASSTSLLRYRLDGVAVNGTSPELSLGTPSQGNHLLQVDLLAPNGTVLAGSEVVFFEDPSAPTPSTSVEPTVTPVASPSPKAPTPSAPLALALGSLAVLALALKRRRT